jgi:8-oxo-dGTP diphosphatase
VSEQPVEAAGAVVWRPGDDTLQVLLIHRTRYDDWSFPKGKLDPGEQALEAAVREVQEETDVVVRLGPLLTRHEYRVERPPGAIKRVTYWSAVPRDGAGADTEAFRPNDEVDQVRWVDIDAAPRQLTYARDAAVLERFCTSAQAQAHLSHPLVVLRHGEALPRKAWRGDDRRRRLSENGCAQAERLAPLLAAYGIERVLSSDAVRCARTVRPYARSADVPIDKDRRWSEDGARPREIRDMVQAMALSDDCVVVCTHRPVLPSVFEALGLDPPRLEPGEALVVHRRGSVVVSTEILRP